MFAGTKFKFAFLAQSTAKAINRNLQQTCLKLTKDECPHHTCSGSTCPLAPLPPASATYVVWSKFNIINILTHR